VALGSSTNCPNPNNAVMTYEGAANVTVQPWG
jgi:hypothetical protein